MTLAADELADMRTAQSESMNDTCQLGTVTESAGSVYLSESISWATAIACGFKAGGGREVQDGSQAVINDAELRLPYDTVVGSANRVKVTKVAGVTLTTAEVYRILGGPLRGPSAIRLKLQRLPGNATE